MGLDPEERTRRLAVAQEKLSRLDVELYGLSLFVEPLNEKIADVQKGRAGLRAYIDKLTKTPEA